jgi:hypothetical protein
VVVCLLQCYEEMRWSRLLIACCALAFLALFLLYLSLHDSGSSSSASMLSSSSNSLVPEGARLSGGIYSEGDDDQDATPERVPSGTALIPLQQAKAPDQARHTTSGIL